MVANLLSTQGSSIPDTKKKKKNHTTRIYQGWGYSSVLELLPGTHKVTGLIPNTTGQMFLK